MQAEHFKGGVHSIAITSEPNVYDRNIRWLAARYFNRFFACCHNCHDIETGFGESGFHLAGDQKIILDDQNTIQFSSLFLRAGFIKRQHRMLSQK